MKKIVLVISFFAHAFAHAQQPSYTLPDSLETCDCFGDTPDTVITFVIQGSPKYSRGALVKCFGGCEDFLYFKKANGWVRVSPTYKDFTTHDLSVCPQQEFVYVVSDDRYYKYLYGKNKFRKHSKKKFLSECT